MKRIEFIAPVESMRGNLSGNQSLMYAVNDNPAYEAPDGVQYARNYQPRFIGAKRGSDGLKYFAVRTKTATNLKATTRRAMAVVGVTAAIRSALMSAHAADYAKMQQAFEYLKAKGQLPEGQDTFKKWFDANVKSMLLYKRETWSFTQASISFTLHNPYDLASADALVIKQATWIKFAAFFIITRSAGNKVVEFAIDGRKFVAEGADGVTWDTIVGAASTQINTNYKNNFAGLTQSDDPQQNPLYNKLPIYLDEVLVAKSVAIIATDKYTTAAPIV